MENENVRDDEYLNRAKRGFLVTMMQRKFEDDMYDIFKKTQFASIEHLDAFVDEKLRSYYSDIDAVKAYYSSKIGE